MKINNLQLKIARGQIVQYFPFLYGRNGRDQLQCLECVYIAIGDNIVIKDAARGYTILANYDHFDEVYPMGILHHVDEIIFDYQWQRIKLDIEWYTLELALDKEYVIASVKIAIARVFIKLGGMVPLFVVMDSSGLVLRDGAPVYKNSLHMVAPAFKFPNVRVCARITQLIYEQLDDAVKPTLDMGVNKSTQHFRTVGSTKFGRTLRALCEPGTWTREDLMITTCKYSMVYPLPPDFLAAVDVPSPVQNPAAVSTGRIREILSMLEVAPYIRGWEFRECIGNFLAFDRGNGAAPYCEFCKRDHNNDNTLIIIDAADGVYVACRRGGSKRISAVVNASSWVIRKLKYFAEKMNLTVDRSHYINPVVYDDSTIRPFPVSPTGKPYYNVAVRANMKMGKTEAAIVYMMRFKRILMLSNRIAFTLEKLQALNDRFHERLQQRDMCLDHKNRFWSYLEIEEETITMRRRKRVILQVDSLHRLVPDKPPHLLVIDECVSIFEQFNSPQIKSHVRTKIHAMFQWLMRRTPHCIIMDANLEPIHMDLLHIYRPGNIPIPIWRNNERVTWTPADNEREIYIENTYRNAVKDKIIFLDKLPMIDRVVTDAKNGVNVVVPTNCKRFADELHGTLIAKGVNKGHILLLTHDTDNETKTRVFNNVNSEWSKYRVVIYTPTCAAGISYTRQHFVREYALFTNNSTTVEMARQMMHRVRNIESREYVVTLEFDPTYACIDTLEKFEAEIRNSKFVIDNEIGITVPHEIDIETDTITYNSCLHYQMWVRNEYMRFSSRANFLRHFVWQCARTGATFEFPERPPGADFSNLSAVMRAACGGANRARDRLILEAPDVSCEEAAAITQKIARSVVEEYTLTRYQFRRAYRYRGAIDARFLETYNNRNTMMIFTNLTAIMKCPTTRESLAAMRARAMANLAPYNDDYARHSCAMALIQLCGFDDITDTKTLTKIEFVNIIERNRATIMDMQNDIYRAFGGRRKIEPNANISAIIHFINGKIFKQYGLRVKAKTNANRDRDTIMICHEYWGRQFETKQSNDKPYVIKGHGIDDIIVDG